MTKSLEQEIREWRSAPITTVKPGALRTLPALQPRDPKASDYRHVHRDEESARQQVERFVDRLRADPLFELDPLLVADIEGTLAPVDGHHRLLAYRRAGRIAVPISVKAMTLQHAAFLALGVNLDGEKRPQTPGQCAESAWQWLAVVTARGRLSLPQGESLRTVSARFGGLSRETVRRMLPKLAVVAERHAAEPFPEAWCNTAFNFPKWKNCRSDHAHKDWDDVPPDVKQLRQVEKCAVKIAQLRDQFGPEVWAAAHALLEESAENPE